MIPDAEVLFVVVLKSEVWHTCVCDTEELYVLLPTQSSQWTEGTMKLGEERERRMLNDWATGWWPIVRGVM
jgi:hypothetical protein